jgi:hypothetical protein
MRANLCQCFLSKHGHEVHIALPAGSNHEVDFMQHRNRRCEGCPCRESSHLDSLYFARTLDILECTGDALENDDRNYL